MTTRWVFLGLSVTSSWGNGHATTYRALLSALGRRGHDVTFLERDMPWYGRNRDLMQLPDATVALYESLPDLQHRFGPTIDAADVIIVGSYVPEGRAVGDWVMSRANGVTAFYDLDTPVTLAQLASDTCDYVSRAQLSRYHLYLSFSGGKALTVLRGLGARHPHPLYCAVDPELHRPVDLPISWDMGYLGTYAEDRQPALQRYLLDAAARRTDQRYVVAGPQYPDRESWPPNVSYVEHLAPQQHPAFYCSQRFTLSVTRRDMCALGHSPSVRLFEAAACGVPIISDHWPGVEDFLTPGEDILIARTTEDVLGYLELPEARRIEIGARARARVLASHTAAHRAQQLEALVSNVESEARAMATSVATRPRRAS